MFELKLALIDAHLRALSDHDDRVWPTLTDDPLPGRQSRDLVADDARSQRQDGGESPLNDQRRPLIKHLKKINACPIKDTKTIRQVGNIG